MKIYKHEQGKNLAEAINKSAKAGVIASVTIKKTDGNTATAVKLYSDEERKYAMDSSDPSLMNLNCILVSNSWNKNDDIFTPEETWVARRTPRSKPANINHIGRESVGNQTIGVIQYSQAVDENYTTVWGNDGGAPDNFEHILCSVSLWKDYWPTAVAQIADGIDKNKQFVSMECIFDDFGYGLRKKDSTDVALLERNDITSWLTSYLRAYGGNGEVKVNGIDYVIGRWLRKINFSGVGFVTDPANPESIIFQDYVMASKKPKISHIKEVEESTWGINQEIISNSAKSSVLKTSGEYSLWLTE